MSETPKERLEYLRGELRAERISYEELVELESLAEHIAPGDVELREAAGLNEHATAQEETDVITVTTTTKVPLTRVADLLVSAFEGGSNYWYFIEERQGEPQRSFVWQDKAGEPQGTHNLPPHIADYALNEGCALVITAHGDDPAENDAINGQSKWLLNLETITKGLHVMAEKNSRHFSDFISESDDAETGDVFLQCCLFGEVIYG